MEILQLAPQIVAGRREHRAHDITSGAGCFAAGGQAENGLGHSIIPILVLVAFYSRGKSYMTTKFVPAMENAR